MTRSAIYSRLPLVLALLLWLAPAPAWSDGVGAAASAQRIVSLNPSLTAILLALGEGERLVGVDDFSARLEPAVSELPRVGGLFNPSLEAVVSLEPDLVVLVPSVEQRDFRSRLEVLGVRVVEFENFQFDQVLSNIIELGALVGRSDEAKDRVAQIEARRAAIASAAANLNGADAPPPRVVLVLQRDPLFVVGSGNFIDAMLASIGVRNLGAEFEDAYPRVSMEWLIASAPDVLVDLNPNAAASLDHWRKWRAIPAVANDRLIALDPELISMPGPHLDRTLDVLARALWGDEILALADAPDSPATVSAGPPEPAEGSDAPPPRPRAARPATQAGATP